MKQNITKKQLNELTKKQKEKLEDWVCKINHREIMVTKELNTINSLELSIGQMIEFLWGKNRKSWEELLDTMDFGQIDPTNLCDALWKAVKEVLES